MADSEIQALEQQIFELNIKLVELRKGSQSDEAIPNYTFQTQNGDTTLLELSIGRINTP